METQIASIANSIKTANSNMGMDFSPKSSNESFSNKFEDAVRSINAQKLYNSKYINANNSVTNASDSNNTIAELKDINNDSEKETMESEGNLTDGSSKLDGEVKGIITDLFKGKIDYNKFQEEINKLPIDDNQKNQLFDVVSTIIQSEEFTASNALTIENPSLNIIITANKGQDSSFNSLIKLEKSSVDKASKLDKKLAGLIGDLLQGKTDFNDVKEEINKLPLGDDNKAQLIDAISKVINSEALTNLNVLANDNVNSNIDIADEKDQDSILKFLMLLAEKEKSSVNESLKSSNDISADKQKKIMGLEELSADKDAELDKKVSNLIADLFQGKVNYSQLQEEINKLPMGDDKKAQLLDIIFKAAGSEELTNDLNSNSNIADDKSKNIILDYLTALEGKGSVNEKLKSLKDIKTGDQKENLAVKELSTGKDAELDEKITGLIAALFQGKIDYSQLQEEVNKLSLDDSKKTQLLGVVSAISKSGVLTASDISSNGNAANKNQDSITNYLMMLSEKKTANEILKSLDGDDNNSVNKKQDNIIDSLMTIVNKEKGSGSEKLKTLKTVLNNVTQALTAAIDDKSNSTKIDLIQKLQSMVRNISEEIDNHTNSNKTGIKYQSIDTLLSARYSAARGSSSEGSDAFKKNNSNIEDILTSLTQKKSDKNDTAMLKINGLVNSLNNENSNVFNNKIADEPISINKNNMVDDVIKSIKFMDTNKIKELTVKINPKELGEVVIKLVAEGNAMRATIQASNKEAYNLLNSQLSEISKNLQDIKIQEISIGISQEDTTYFANQSNDQSQGKQQNNKQSGSSMINNISGDLIEEELPIINSNINALA